jgi:uncharacterized membrane protein YfhO
MVKVILAVVAGFFAWAFAWVGSEMVLSAIWPDWYGAHQRAFTAAIKTGSAFTADTTVLIIHIVCAAAVSVLAGFLAALIARESQRAPIALGVLLTAFAVLKAVMSWPYVPVWYHILFTVLLIPMVMLGGRLRAAKQ